MKKLVLDSWAVLTFLHKEKAHDKIRKKLDVASKGKITLFISIINIAEIYYKLIRNVGKEEAIKTIYSLDQLSIKVIPVTNELIFRAAEFKADYPISLADCFTVVLAKEKKAPILTGDPEFKKVEKLVKIEWL